MGVEDNLVAPCPLRCGNRTTDPTMACITCHTAMINKASTLVNYVMKVTMLVGWILSAVLADFPWWVSVLALLTLFLVMSLAADVLGTVMVDKLMAWIKGDRR